MAKKRKIFANVLGFTTVIAATSVLYAATFPPDGSWIPLTSAGQGLSDPPSDGNGNGRELVGTNVDPAVFIYSDGTDFCTRLRVDTDPLQSVDDLRPYGWGLLIDTDGDYNNFEFSLLADGISEQIEFAENTSPGNTGDPGDLAETLISSPAHDYAPGGNIRVVTANTAINATQDYFIDFCIPLSDLTGAGISLSAPLAFWAGTSSNARSISVDLANDQGPASPGDLPNAVSDPVVINDIIDSDGDGVADGQDSDPNDMFVCRDDDNDGCDDCSTGTYDPDDDGPDADGDGTCDDGDTDDDNDGIDDALDPNPSDPDLCGDSDSDSCDDCAVGTDDFGPMSDSLPANDGPDFDSDGLCDVGDDSDSDGLTDAEEIAAGSDPNDADSDDDGVRDGDEVDWNTDTDGDGLINVLDPDSDNDGLFDGLELGLDCNDPATDTTLGHCTPDGDAGATTTDPLKKDTDDGGVSDGSEDINLNGVVDAGEIDPNDGTDDAGATDTDGDGLTDDFEDAIGSDKNDGDTDDDGVLDGDEANPSDDTDGDGIINVLDVDSDNDGLADGTEVGNACNDPDTDTTKNHCVPDADDSTTTSSLKKDTDNGGVSDGNEDTNLNGAIDGGELDPNNPNDDVPPTDTDGDGLSDDLEGFIGTSPTDADSDNDGILDGAEPNFADDHDGDGLINANDPDSDEDGILDGTELGTDCMHADTDQNDCVPDADAGGTTTNPLDDDTDNGGLSDGAEDVNFNGAIDDGEKDPNDPADDDDECVVDADCGNATSGRVCHDTDKECVDGCRGMGGNGCPADEECTSTDTTIGTCEDPSSGAGGAAAGGSGAGAGGPGSGGAGAGGPGSGGAGAGGNGLIQAQGGCDCRVVAPKRGVGDAWLLALFPAVAFLRRRRR